jgi:hypothetical protein
LFHQRETGWWWGLYTKSGYWEQLKDSSLSNVLTSLG